MDARLCVCICVMCYEYALQNYLRWIVDRAVENEDIMQMDQCGTFETTLK